MPIANSTNVSVNNKRHSASKRFGKFGQKIGTFAPKEGKSLPFGSDYTICICVLIDFNPINWLCGLPFKF